MFARFRNLFSKNKIEKDVSVGNSSDEISPYVIGSGKDFLKQEEGLNCPKILVENEKQNQLNSTVESTFSPPNSLGEEMAELLKKRLSKCDEFESVSEQEINNKNNRNNNENIDGGNECFGYKETEKESAYCGDNKVSNDCLIQMKEGFLNQERDFHPIDVSPPEFLQLLNNEENIVAQNDTNEDNKQLNLELNEKVKEDIKPQNEISDENELHQINALNENINIPKQEILIETKDSSLAIIKSNNSESKQIIENESKVIDNSHVKEIELKSSTNDSIFQQPNAYYPNDNIDSLNDLNNVNDCNKNSNELSESSISAIKENASCSTTPFSLENSKINLSNNSSIVVEDLPTEITTPSPTVESTISSSSSNTSTLDSSSATEVLDPSKIIVNPIDNNGLACTAITGKLSDIAEVAESLDAVIRDVQENFQTVEVESNPSPSQKKLATLRSASSEDWHSRSTEDDSFATASEGNFTPSSSSYQTASGRTSSYISCDKNSFDANEADDSTYTFEMPELTSPLNVSFEGSEQSYMSVQHPNGEMTIHKKSLTSTKFSESGNKSANLDDQSSIADIEELHSESITPTFEKNNDDYHEESIPIELTLDGIADAPSMEILTENTTMPTSKTPEVSPSTANASSNQNTITTLITVNDQQQQQQQNSNTNINKPNAAWRRSKYYENITKQTIKGFL